MVDPLRTGRFYARRSAPPPAPAIHAARRGAAGSVHALLSGVHRASSRVIQPKEEVVLLSETSPMDLCAWPPTRAKEEPQEAFPLRAELRVTPADAAPFAGRARRGDLPPAGMRKRSRTSQVFDAIARATPLAPAVVEDAARRGAVFSGGRHVNSRGSGGSDCLGLFAGVPQDAVLRTSAEDDERSGVKVESAAVGVSTSHATNELVAETPIDGDHVERTRVVQAEIATQSCMKGTAVRASNTVVEPVPCEDLEEDLRALDDIGDDWDDVTRVIAKQRRPSAHMERGDARTNSQPTGAATGGQNGGGKDLKLPQPGGECLSAPRTEPAPEGQATCSFCHGEAERISPGPAGRDTLCRPCSQRWYKYHAKQKRRGVSVDRNYIPPPGRSKRKPAVPARQATEINGSSGNVDGHEFAHQKSLEPATGTHHVPTGGSGAIAQGSSLCNPVNEAAPTSGVGASRHSPSPAEKMGFPPSSPSCPPETTSPAVPHAVPSPRNPEGDALDDGLPVAPAVAASNRGPEPEGSPNESAKPAVGSSSSKLCTPSAEDQSSRVVNTPVANKVESRAKRKGGRTSEVLRLQKSMETAMWTVSREVQSLAEPVSLVDDDETDKLQGAARTPTGNLGPRRTPRLVSSARQESSITPQSSLPQRGRRSSMPGLRVRETRSHASSRVTRPSAGADTNGSARKQATPSRLEAPAEVDHSVRVETGRNMGVREPIAKRRRLLDYGSNIGSLKPARGLHKFDRPVQRAPG